MSIDLKDPEIRYLIDYANIKQGIIKYQNNFLDKKKLKYNNFKILYKKKVIDFQSKRKAKYLLNNIY